MTFAAIIVAAGRGVRAGGHIPKQWQMLGSKTVAAHALETFGNHPNISQLVLVLHPDDIDSEVWPRSPRTTVAIGGTTRRESVVSGLNALSPEVTHVLIHDAARPLVSRALIDRVIAALETCDGAAPALQVTDALWRGDAELVSGTQDRSGLFRAQTPQGFAVAQIRAAHAAMITEATDDVAVARAFGIDVKIVPGDENNLKITGPEDFSRAEQLLRGPMDIRLGNGFDVHRFGAGDHVWLCGVKVPHDHSLQGHSDADVGMHAVTDAIYGALAKGDIGQHFPPSDPQWKGAASHIFLAHACALARELGFSISNVDCTLICEYPKIGPHAFEMKTEMARIMGMDVNRISVKATTSERLGFTGRGEGIAAIATATLVKT